MAKILNLSIEQQQCSEWCWAAVTFSVCQCYGDGQPANQQGLANQVLGQPPGSQCQCQQNHLAACNQPENLAAVLNVFHHGRDGSQGISTMAFEEVKAEIDGGRPVVVQVTLEDPAASGHAIVIFGYTDDGMVSIGDPMHAGDRISVRFSDFVAGVQANLGDLHGTWQAAYRTKGIND